MAADIRRAVDHAEHLIGALLILARTERGLSVHEEVDIAHPLDALDAADHGDREVHATLEPAVISGSPVLARRLIANLLDDATAADVPGGMIWIRTETKLARRQLTPSARARVRRSTPSGSSSRSSESTTGVTRRASAWDSPSWRPSPRFTVEPRPPQPRPDGGLSVVVKKFVQRLARRRDQHGPVNPTRGASAGLGRVRSCPTSATLTD